jgi:hypothetical protein
VEDTSTHIPVPPASGQGMIPRIESSAQCSLARRMHGNGPARYGHHVLRAKDSSRTSHHENV